MILFLALGACDGCSCAGDAAIAELVSKEGAVERDFDSSREQWEDAAVGAEFGFGDAVRTGETATARVQLIGGSALQVDPRTLVRFLRGLPDQETPGLDVETGSAVLEAATAISVRTQVGAAALEPGTRLRLSAGDDGLAYEVLVGQAEIEADGASTTLGAGDQIVVSMEGAVLEEEPATEPDAGMPDAGPPPDAGSVDDEIVLDVQARGVRARGPSDRRWRALGRGESTVDPGTSLRLPRRARVGLRRGDASGTLTGAGTFVVGGEDALVSATSGGVSFESGGGEVHIAVPGGVIVARAGSSQGEAAVEARRGTEVRALRGTLEVRSEDGTTQVIETGESARLQRGGEVERELVVPARPHFFVEAGASFTVRDPRPPSAIGLRFGGKCSGAGVVEIRGISGGANGTGSANVSLPAGRYAYALRCVAAEGTLGPSVADGTVRVMRDPGRTLLARVPPATVVDTDGRRYTILYQTLLPEITVRWPNGPATGPYRLEVGSGSRARTFAPTGLRHQFESGVLGEGVHPMTYIAGGTRSPTTTLAIGFDNAAPTASVRSPDDGSFAPGQTVRVAGIALAGWSVAVDGTPLPLDPQQRFEAQVQVPPTQDGIAIRLSHPSRGVHYYVRHGSSGN
jgi:ferric-dicitrate binding protein FerR (iron transport regulator)